MTIRTLGDLIPWNGGFAEDVLLCRNISMTQLREVVGKRIPAKHKLMVVAS